MPRYPLLALAALATTQPLFAQTPPPPPPAEAKTQAMAYVTAAGKSDLYEINSSQIALQKSQNADVRKFAEMLIKHHQMTTAATLKAAQKAGLTPPPPMLDAGATASINDCKLPDLQISTGFTSASRSPRIRRRSISTRATLQAAIRRR